MKNEDENGVSRRTFLQLSASMGVLASLGSVEWAFAQPPDYKALVCVFLFGGNDGHNVIVPLDAAQYTEYSNARRGLALAQSSLLPVTDAQGAFGLHPSLVQTRQLYQSGHAAVIANVGLLVGPTGYDDLADASRLPLNLRSHSDQIVQMQTGMPRSAGSTGWGGRAADSVATFNTGATFPVSVAIGSSPLFCTGSAVPASILQVGNTLNQIALNYLPTSTAQARAQAQQEIASMVSSNPVLNAANRPITDAIALHPLLVQAQNSVTWNTPFPTTDLGSQLEYIARIISIQSQVGVGRQIFFASLGGFDTHATQTYNQGVLLEQVDRAIGAFYAATEQLGQANSVTTFTLSDFGRTLQPSGSGSDHGWGNHHIVAGGAVNGGSIYGTFPLMTNFTNLNATAEDFADARGTLLPRQSLSQYGATLANWFGADPNATFADLAQYGGFSDMGFLA